MLVAQIPHDLGGYQGYALELIQKAVKCVLVFHALLWAKSNCTHKWSHSKPVVCTPTPKFAYKSIAAPLPTLAFDFLCLSSCFFQVKKKNKMTRVVSNSQRICQEHDKDPIMGCHGDHFLNELFWHRSAAWSIWRNAMFLSDTISNPVLKESLPRSWTCSIAEGHCFRSFFHLPFLAFQCVYCSLYFTVYPHTAKAKNHTTDLIPF